MKINPYYISAAVAVVVIVVIFMSRRDNATRDWNSTNFILSADNNGNLTPITEDFFKQKEDELLAKVDAKLDNVYTKSETFTKTEINNALSKKSNNHGHDYYTKGQTYNRDQTYTRSQTNDVIATALAPFAKTTTIKAAINAGRDGIPASWSTKKDFQRYVNTVHGKL